MAKCPQCAEEVLLESSGWNWISSCKWLGLFTRTSVGLSSPFNSGCFKCPRCKADSLSVRPLDIFIFRIIDIAPLFIFMLVIFSSIRWLNLNNVWLFLILFPLGAIALWWLILYKLIVNFWWRNIVQLQVQVSSEKSDTYDTVFFILLLLGAGKGVEFLVKHVLFK